MIGIVTQGAPQERRPWALLYNRFAVKAGLCGCGSRRRTTAERRVAPRGEASARLRLSRPLALVRRGGEPKPSPSLAYEKWDEHNATYALTSCDSIWTPSLTQCILEQLDVINHDGDRRVLAALASRGSDLTKPAHTIHYLYFKSIDAAKTSASELQAAGYQKLRVHRAPTKSIWKRLFGPHEYSCIAETHAVPSEANVFTTTDRMNALAQKLGGDYDGWEASIER